MTLREYIPWLAEQCPLGTAADLEEAHYRELRELIDIHPVTPLPVVAKRLKELEKPNAD